MIRMLVNGRTNYKKAYITIYDDTENGSKIIYKKELNPDVLKILGAISTYKCEDIEIYTRYKNWNIKIQKENNNEEIN